jgi:hypothetical protein
MHTQRQALPATQTASSNEAAALAAPGASTASKDAYTGAASPCFSRCPQNAALSLLGDKSAWQLPAEEHPPIVKALRAYLARFPSTLAQLKEDL